MKFSIFKLLLILIVFFSSSPEIKAQESLFFDFDQVDYYSTDISIQGITEIEYKRKKKIFVPKKISKKEALFLSILKNNYPETIEEDFPKKIIKYGFKKNNIDKKLYPEISNIFSEKSCSDNLDSFLHSYI